MRILIAGGKTGGHIFPAIAVMKEMKNTKSNVSFFFIGSGSNIEKLVFEGEPIFYEKINVYPIMGMGLKALKSIFLLPLSLFDSLDKIKRIKPHCILGMGGYSSGPVILAGFLKGIPVFIHEQNFKPGLTNRILKIFAKKVFYSFRNSGKYFGKKGVYTGNPVRDEFIKIKEEKGEEFTILVFGGSQGSSLLNNVFAKAVPKISESLGKLRVFHATGEKDYEMILKEYERLNSVKWEVKPFFRNIWDYFVKADLLITRAGAGTIFEILACGKASILIPFSKSAGSHQIENAFELKREKVSEVILEKELSEDLLSSLVIELARNPMRIKEMEEKAKSLAVIDSATRISNAILKEIQT
ncbi:MAG: undecaprenyldiphospho-muramoylpentapeptide beta-N-acetylglucosaminyltransferase [Candidatus Aminicenantia bacterium]